MMAMVVSVAPFLVVIVIVQQAISMFQSVRMYSL